MKKFKYLMVIAVVLMFGLAGCDGKKDAKGPAKSEKQIVAEEAEKHEAAKTVAVEAQKVAVEEKLPPVPMPPLTNEKVLRITASHYTAWEAWYCADSMGILKKWGDKYGVEVVFQPFNSYVASIEAYNGGEFDACVMTNMDALIMPAQAGVDSMCVVPGDTSNGNDKIIGRKGYAESLSDLKGKDLHMVVGSVTDYMVSRAFSLNGMRYSDVTYQNVVDETTMPMMYSGGDEILVATWNPFAMTIMEDPNAVVLFDSSQIPGEIIDMMVVRSNAPESFKKILVGSWFEVMQMMTSRSNDKDKILQCMADSAGGTMPQFKAQLKTTNMFYTPESELEFVRSPKLIETMELVRTHYFDKGFLEDITHKDDIGISFPNGVVLGDRDKVKLRFEDKYLQMAIDGQL